jgi:putative membrane protein
VNKADQDFMLKAAEGGLTEVTLGQLASGKATSPDVKTFGDQMVTDHGKANDQLKALAQQKGVTLPTGLGKDGESTSNKLSGMTGAAFDKAYMQDMVKDHEGDVKEFEKASKSATDPDLKTWVTNTLPTLQNHLKMAKDTLAKVKG